MKKKYFFVIFLTFISISVLTLLIVYLLFGKGYTLLLPFALSVLLSYISARLIAKSISSSIASIDPDDVDPDECTVEMKPLLRKIVRQDALIARQMAELKQGKEEFKAITENMAEGLIVTGSDGEIIIYNSKAQALFDPEHIKTNVLLLCDDEGFTLAVHSALAGSSSTSKITVLDGIYRIYANPLIIDSKASGAVIIVHDITEQDKMEVMRREFTSNVSHELKTPLTSIYGISEILSSGIVSEDDIPRFLQNIHSETGRLITLVNDIIKLSQMDENSIMEEKEGVSLLKLAYSVCDRLKPIAESKKITLTVSGCDVEVFGIKGILDEMIYNLADNSIKYNTENGNAAIKIIKKDDKAILEVSDTGIGISPMHIGRIFERFYRVDKSHSKQVGGTGLGLSIVKHGAFYHGATIDVESTLGKGTVIRVNFPLNANK